MRSKFTNQDLYDWMVDQIAGVYFQSYQLAFDTARRAERAYRFELGFDDSDYISFGYWDSLRKGLLAGERLYHDLKRMETAYLDQNKREYEITKHVSLALLDPVALVSLRQEGQCFVDLPEALFDLDCPGHYMRRIKSVSLTIPCVAGPYTSVNCTLTLLSSKVRTKGLVKVEYSHPDNYTPNSGALQSIVTSAAQNDSGLFELNFRDERYLPFEGAGAISSWRIELPRKFRQFDYATITDVILHVRYTAREGGAVLREKAENALKDHKGPLLQPAKNQPLLAQLIGQPDGDKPEFLLLLSAKHDFPTEWHRFVSTTSNPSLGIWLTKNLFPYQFSDKNISVSQIGVAVILKNAVDNLEVVKIEQVTPNPSGNQPTTLNAISSETLPSGGGTRLFAGSLTFSTGPKIYDESQLSTVQDPCSLQLSGITGEGLTTNAIEDILLICRY